MEMKPDSPPLAGDQGWTRPRLCLRQLGSPGPPRPRPSLTGRNENDGGDDGDQS